VVLVAQELHILLADGLVVERHDRLLDAGGERVGRFVPVLSVGVGVRDRGRLDRLERRVRESPRRDAVVLEDLVVDDEVERRPDREVHDRARGPWRSRA